MPVINIEFYPGTACENLGLDYQYCSDGWNLYSIPLLHPTDDISYTPEELFGQCTLDNPELNGFQIVTDGNVSFCATQMGWLGSLQEYQHDRGYFTRNYWDYAYSIPLSSELPSYDELPVDSQGIPYWSTLNYGFNLESFPGTNSTSDGYSCMSNTSDHWYYRIQNTLDQYHYDENPIRNKHNRMISTSANVEDPDDFSWIMSYQDRISDQCPDSSVCCQQLCENNNGEYNCNSNVSVGWGSLGTLMCNYTNTCCNVSSNTQCTYLDGELAFNYGIDTSCQVLHPIQQGVCVYPDWDAYPERAHDYCRSLSSSDCNSIDLCVDNNYCSVYPTSLLIYGECRISELLPLGDMINVGDVPGGEYEFEWNPSENPACGNGYLGHTGNCDNGECMNAYHHCYACGGEWIPSGPVISPDEMCDSIGNSIQNNLSSYPQIEVLTYNNPLPESSNYPIWAIHGSRCFAETNGFWIFSQDDGAHFSFFPDMETYYITNQQQSGDGEGRTITYEYDIKKRVGRRERTTAGNCRFDDECPLNFRCDEEIHMCVPINALSINNLNGTSQQSALFDFEGIDWSIYMYNGTPGTDTTIPGDRGPSNIEPGGPQWLLDGDIPENLINDVIRTGVTANNYIPPMPIDYKGGYHKYIKDYHFKLSQKTGFPIKKRRKSKKLKRKR